MKKTIMLTVALFIITGIAGAMIYCNQAAAFDGKSAANANVYYVSPVGKDSNPGTITRPWKTIQYAADKLVAGDTLYIRKGTYNERVVPKKIFL